MQFRRINVISTLLFSLLISGTSHSQLDPDNYTTLLSSGPIPKDFTEFTYTKLEDDLKNERDDLTFAQKQEFYTGINYAIDALLHSGLVIYGDPISEYVRDIAEKLLFDNKELFNELRFYTIKSNATNAFATDQGIVFVTTGLLSQITNEAQLALVLSHEISHYTEKHARESYEYIVDNRKSSIENLSIYSKDLELSADNIGLKMYANAGYSKETVIPTFDVLLYSHLPFDEVQIPNEYFTSIDSLFVPNYLFPEVPYEINVSEDEDDSKSSHPNIKTRKREIKESINAIKNWKNDTFKLGEERFEKIRNYARFEVVRNNLHEAEYGRALYSIFLLEQQYPSSLFLQRMKAQAWLGLLQYQVEGSISRVIDRKSQLEGASGNVHHFLNELSSEQLITMSVRQVYDIRKLYPEDAEIEAIYDYLLKAISSTNKFGLTDYASISFNSAYAKTIVDTNDVKIESIKSDEKLSKYDRIKVKKNTNVPLSLDSSDFHIYLIPDVIVDPYFIEKYNTYEELFEKAEELAQKEDQSDVETNTEQVDHLISVQPFVSVSRGGSVNLQKSEKFSLKSHECIEIAGKEAGIKITHLDKMAIIEEGTEKFNEYSVLLSYLVQSGNDTDINSFPVDFQLTQNLTEKFGTSHVMYSTALRDYNVDFRFGTFILTVIVYPFLPVYLAYIFIDAPNNEMQMLALDMKTGNVVGAMDLQFKAKLRKYSYAAHMYDFFHLLNK